MHKPGTTKPLLIGIIGCGAIVQKSHVPSLRNIPDVRIAWISDVNEKPGTTVAAAIGASFYDHNIALVERPVVDILLVAIPYGARSPVYEQVHALADKRPSLFVEKPFARSIEEHLSIISPFPDWDVGLNLTRRSMGIIQCARRLVQEGVFGKVRYVDVRFGGLGRILTRGGYMADLKLAGGGMLMEMGVHYIDAALFSVGAHDVQLLNGRAIYHDGFDVHIEAQLAITGADGKQYPFRIKVTAFEPILSGIWIGLDNAVVQFDFDINSKLTVKGYSKQSSEFELNKF